MLDTPEKVIQRAGLTALPQYEDVSPMSDSPGFYTFRPYPAETELSQILTTDGRPAVRCYLAFIVLPPTDGSPISRVELRAWFARRWRPNRVVSSSGDPYAVPADHPDAPSSRSVPILARTRKPIDLDHTDSPTYLYDPREDVFLDSEGKTVNPVQILDRFFAMHCRTLGRGFRIRWDLGSAARWIIRQTVWKGQDIAMSTLTTFYDVEVVDDKKDTQLNPFRRYRPRDFRRTTEKEGERSHFFGFQTSRKSLFTNLTVVVAACLLVYWNAPRGELVSWIYNNTALSTAALVFLFLLADTFGPWILIRVICILSRLRDAVLFFIRKVKV
jgi:hypothetical protein